MKIFFNLADSAANYAAVEWSKLPNRPPFWPYRVYDNEFYINTFITWIILFLIVFVNDVVFYVNITDTFSYVSIILIR